MIYITDYSKKGNQIHFELNGEIIQANEPGSHGVVYPIEVLRESIERFQTKILEKKAVGNFLRSAQLTQFKRTPNAESHLVTRLALDNIGMVAATVTLLDTPAGLQLKDYLVTFVKRHGDSEIRELEFSLCGSGKTKRKNGCLTVLPGYVIKTVDIIRVQPVRGKD